MNRFLLSCSAFALLLATITQAKAAPLLSDGSFEDTTHFQNQGNDTDDVSGTDLQPWNVVVNSVSWIGPTNTFIDSAGGQYKAEDGSYFLDLTSYHDNTGPYGGVTQTVATQAGAQYDLTFFIGADNGISSIFASAGDSSNTLSYTTFGHGSTWGQVDLKFTALSNSTTISLIGQLASHGGTYIGLDNVSLVQTAGAPVPEPSSLALLGLGGLGLAIGAYRRRRAAAAV